MNVKPENKSNSKGNSYEKNNNKCTIESLKPLDSRLNKLVAKIITACMRLDESEIHELMRHIGDFCSGKTSKASRRYPWSKADIVRCYLRMQPISEKVASHFLGWASEYRESEHDFRSAYKARIAELVHRNRVEKL